MFKMNTQKTSEEEEQFTAERLASLRSQWQLDGEFTDY